MSPKQPRGNSQDFFNRKQYHSIILQGVCDAFGSFIDVYIGMPGRMHDARVFQKSILYQKLTDQQNPLLQGDKHLIGDSAYPLLVSLITPFRNNGHLQENQIRYNVRLSSIRSVIERAFGLLKCKFRRLKYLDTSDVNFANHIIAAACVLHNFIIANGETDESTVILDTQEIENLEDVEMDDSHTLSIPQRKRNFIMHNL